MITNWNERDVPVATLHNQEETEETLLCLRDSGLKVIEITYRTEYARMAIEYAVKNFPEILVGAGTVINKKQCKEAIAIGAKFIVGPGFSKAVARVCKRKKVLYIPGVVTPSEVQQAVNCGLTLLKFFPYSTFGGIATVNALAGPFPNVKFILTNGITEENFSELLQNPHVAGVGGSWMLKGTRADRLAKMKKAAGKA